MVLKESKQKTLHISHKASDKGGIRGHNINSINKKETSSSYLRDFFCDCELHAFKIDGPLANIIITKSYVNLVSLK